MILPKEFLQEGFVTKNLTHRGIKGDSPCEGRGLKWFNDIQQLFEMID